MVEQYDWVGVLGDEPPGIKTVYDGVTAPEVRGYASDYYNVT